MNGINRSLIDQFPSAEEINPVMSRIDVLSSLARALEGSRAAIDELTSAGMRTLSVEEQMKLGSVSEQVARLASDIQDWQH